MLSSKVKCALMILSELEKAATEGIRLTMTDIHNRCGMEKRLVCVTVYALRRKAWAKCIGSKQVLVKDLTSATLCELVLDIDGSICLGGPNIEEGWTKRFQKEYPQSKEINLRLQEEMEQQLSGIFIRDIFPCISHRKEMPKTRRYQRRRIKR